MTFWTRERIIDAMLSWYAEVGEPPTCSEWRRAAPGVPGVSTVVERFGSWNNAVAAAGFAPRPRGQQRKERGA